MYFHYTASCVLSSCIQEKRGFDLITCSRPWALDRLLSLLNKVTSFTLRSPLWLRSTWLWTINTLSTFAFPVEQIVTSPSKAHCGLNEFSTSTFAYIFNTDKFEVIRVVSTRTTLSSRSLSSPCSYGIGCRMKSLESLPVGWSD